MSKKLSQVFKIAQKVLDAQDSSRRSGSSASSSGGSLRATLENAVSTFGGGARPTGSAPGDAQPQRQQPQQSRTAVPDSDRQAIARYDYLMQTADPHQVEQIHAEAFARLTPAQREAVRQRMQADLPPHEQPRSADVADLSRAAGRAEARRPGSVRSVLAKVGKGGLVGGVAVGAVGLLGVVAAGAAVSSVAGPLLAGAADLGVDFDSLASGLDLGALDVEGLSGVGDLGAGVEDLAGAAEGTLGSLGDTVSGAGQSLSDLGSGFDPRDLF
jgi:hypothetical protein